MLQIFSKSLDAVKQRTSIFKAVTVLVLILDTITLYRHSKDVEVRTSVHDTCSLGLKSIGITWYILDTRLVHNQLEQGKHTTGTAARKPSILLFLPITLTSCLSIGRLSLAFRYHAFPCIATASCLLSIFSSILIHTNISFKSDFQTLMKSYVVRIVSDVGYKVIVASPMILKNISELIVLYKGAKLICKSDISTTEAACIVAVEVMRSSSCIICYLFAIPVKPFPRVARLMTPMQSLATAPLTITSLAVSTILRPDPLHGVMFGLHVTGIVATNVVLARDLKEDPDAYAVIVYVENALKPVVVILSLVSTAITVVGMKFPENFGVISWISCGLNLTVTVLNLPTLGFNIISSRLLIQNMHAFIRFYDKWIINAMPDDYLFIAEIGERLMQQQYPCVYACSMIMFFLCVFSEHTPSPLVPIMALISVFVSALEDANNNDWEGLGGGQLQRSQLLMP